MNEIIKKGIFVFAGLLLFGCSFSTVFASEYIDVEYPVGTNLNGGKIFSEKNIYPGWSKSKLIRVGNKSDTDSANLYFTFDVTKGKKLAKKLKAYIYILRKKSHNYDLVETKTLSSDKDIKIGQLGPNEKRQYKIKIEFDKAAGNEYQGKEVNFDIAFNIRQKVISSGNLSQQVSNNQNLRNASGEGNKINNIENNQNKNGNVAGVNKKNSGKTLGEESVCRSLPRWVWILATLVFFGLSLFSTKKTKKEKIRQHFSWQLGGVAGAIALWYFFDKCQHYKWFPIMVVVIGILNHLYYQKFKGIRKN